VQRQGLLNIHDASKRTFLGRVIIAVLRLRTLSGRFDTRILEIGSGTGPSRVYICVQCGIVLTGRVSQGGSYDVPAEGHASALHSRETGSERIYRSFNGRMNV
jgi:hypothetical protein